MSASHIPFARKLGAFRALSNHEITLLDQVHNRRKPFEAGRDIIHEGQVQRSAYILASGWVCSYKLLPNGTRQIVDFKIPGDFLGMHSVLFRAADHNIEPLTRIEASEVQPNELLETFHTAPRLAAAVLWAASRDEAMVVEHLVNIGRRSAKERMAHFLLEMSARLNLVGLATPDGFACPLTQYMLGDALGLSAVHVNRVLRELREDGFVTFQNGRVEFQDFDGLVDFAEFDWHYLDHEGPLLK